jgi:hypothetical protein
MGCSPSYVRWHCSSAPVDVDEINEFLSVKECLPATLQNYPPEKMKFAR